MKIDKYQEYLKSQKWNDIKKLVFKRDKYVCQGCLTETKNLQAHHLTYDRIYNEMCFDLITLCRKCHCNIHGLDCVDEYLNKRSPKDYEQIHKLNGSIIVGYETSNSKDIEELMNTLDKNGVTNYYAYRVNYFIEISSNAYKKIVTLNNCNIEKFKFLELKL